MKIYTIIYIIYIYIYIYIYITNHGVRPIVVGEVLRRIMGNVINWILKDDIQEYVGPLQTTIGLKVGAEAAIH